jgi:regulator of sigma E protease
LYIFIGQPVTPPVAAAVMAGSAAEQAGFQPHDEVVAIDGVDIRRFEDIRREVMVGLDTERVFTIRRDGNVIDIKASPVRLQDEDRFGFSQSRGLLGLISPGNAIDISHIVSIDGAQVEGADSIRAALVSRLGQEFRIGLSRGEEVDVMFIRPLPDLNEGLTNPESEDHNFLVIANTVEETFVKHNIIGGLAAATQETANITVSTLQALGQMVTGTRSTKELGGIIRIGAIAGDMAKSGILALITFTALLSINLGLINLFPIPMLDGGHLVFYAIEAVKGSPISEQIQEYAFRLGLAILVGIMLFANLNDIVQLIL